MIEINNLQLIIVSNKINFQIRYFIIIISYIVFLFFFALNVASIDYNISR